MCRGELGALEQARATVKTSMEARLAAMEKLSMDVSGVSGIKSRLERLGPPPLSLMGKDGQKAVDDFLKLHEGRADVARLKQRYSRPADVVELRKAVQKIMVDDYAKQVRELESSWATREKQVAADSKQRARLIRVSFLIPR